MDGAAPTGGSAGALGARLRFACVLLVWALLLADALRFVAWAASPIAISDDLMFLLPLLPEQSLTLTELWSPINEHRVPLVRLVVHGLLLLGCDTRGGMYAQVLVLAAVALGSILLARRLRGGTSLADAVFPLLWLHQGYADSWIFALQLTVALPIALVVANLALVLGARGPLAAGRISAVGACTLLLGTCGGFGWSQMPPWILWLAYAGWNAARAGRRRAAGCAWVAAALALAYCAVYPLGLPERDAQVPFELVKLVGIALQFVSLSAGAAAYHHAWPSLALALALIVGTGYGLARVGVLRREERERSGALLAALLGTLGLGVAIGVARQDAWPIAGLAGRYMGGPTPAVAAAVLAVALYARSRWLRAAPWVLALALAATLPLQRETAYYVGAERRALTRELDQAVAAGATLDELSERFWTRCMNGPVTYRRCLATQLELRVAPFDRPLQHDPLRFERDPLSALEPRPTQWRAPRPPVYRRLEGRDALLLNADGELVFALPPGTTRVRARYGVPPIAWADFGDAASRTRGVVFAARLGRDGPPLWEQELDPVQRAEDRGLRALELSFPAGREARELVLSVRGRVAPSAGPDWGAFAAVELD